MTTLFLSNLYPLLLHNLFFNQLLRVISLLLFISSLFTSIFGFLTDITGFTLTKDVGFVRLLFCLVGFAAIAVKMVDDDDVFNLSFGFCPFFLRLLNFRCLDSCICNRKGTGLGKCVL